MIEKEAWHVEADERELARLERDALKGGTEALLSYWSQLERLGYPKTKITEPLLVATWNRLLQGESPLDKMVQLFYKLTPYEVFHVVLPDMKLEWGEETWYANTEDFEDGNWHASDLDWQPLSGTEWEPLLSHVWQDHPFRYLVTKLSHALQPNGDDWQWDEGEDALFSYWSTSEEPYGDGLATQKFYLKVREMRAETVCMLAWEVAGRS